MKCASGVRWGVSREPGGWVERRGLASLSYEVPSRRSLFAFVQVVKGERKLVSRGFAWAGPLTVSGKAAFLASADIGGVCVEVALAAGAEAVVGFSCGLDVLGAVLAGDVDGFWFGDFVVGHV
jgi:hypothetical protein